VLELLVHTARRTQLLDITAVVNERLGGRECSAVVVFVPHTTAGLVLQASGTGAAAVAADVESALERIVDEGWSWQHTSEGDRNPWAHVRAALTGSSVMIPVTDCTLALGEFQSLFLCEFDGPRERTVRLTPL
jgi:secondary thiamine-phosphate synthase enzyme